MDTLNILSPMPPVKSGIADYCYEQIPALAQDWNINIIVDKKVRTNIALPHNVNVTFIDEWQNSNAYRDPNARIIYHIGNNPHHEFVFEEALKRPGIVVLHDYCNHHLITELTLARGNHSRYKDFMEKELGELGISIANGRTKGVYSEALTFAIPLNSPVLSSSKGVITHSNWAKAEIMSRFNKLETCRIPHHYLDQGQVPETLSRRDARIKLNLADDKVIIVSLGFITAPKQVSLAIKALGNIQHLMPPFEYWLVGEPQNKTELEKLISKNKLTDKVKITGYVTLEKMENFIQASDIIVNLRYPTAGETSGTLIRALGVGRSAIIFDYGPFLDYPDNTVFKLPLDTFNTANLESAFLELSNDKGARERLEINSRAHINSHHSIQECTSLYTDFINRIYQ